MLITLTNALLGYRNHLILQVPRLAIDRGTCLGIYGPNGSGKTTLIKTLAGLLKPLSGEITRAADLNLAYLPQSRFFDPAWPMTAFDAAAMPASARTACGWLGRADQAVLDEMDRLDVRHLASRAFAKLSGGQQQRVLLAGVLATRPRLLLLDEPTEGLDHHSRLQFLQTLKQSKSDGLAIVFITHDPADLEQLADQTAHLHIPEDEGHPAVLKSEIETRNAPRH
jgi:ABC-type Mn2+/Zn2+ transport system ATPase subunit